MIYSIRHTTTFRYDPAVRESVMEVRMQPRSEAQQRCFKFQLEVTPAVNVMQYRDFMGNAVHHFDIAPAHSQLQVKAISLVEVQPVEPVVASAVGDWADLDALLQADDYWEMLLPSQFARPSRELETLTNQLDWRREGNPLELLTRLNREIYQWFSYVPNSTQVDSPIEELGRTTARILLVCARILRIS